jgi:hypothetical protein
VAATRSKARHRLYALVCRGKIYEEIACNREGMCGQGLAIPEQGAGLADGVVSAQQVVGREHTADGCQQPMGSRETAGGLRFRISSN